ncbi:MAG: hypothetical protein NUV86_09535 [Candidatus Scalindua sp.]|nr:hypothetical protein [Candidatus Scalindua sp.]
MKILYIPAHSILEYDEVRLLSELGHDVFSMDSYRNPASPIDVKRPPILGMEYHEYLDRLVSQCSRENLHEELISWADILIFMHIPQWVYMNWNKIKHKKVIWRSIGQSSPNVESALFIAKSQGLKIVRYSPAEENIRGYIGSHAMIRFYKDPLEFGDYNGDTNKVITMAQNMRTPRSASCNWNTWEASTEGFDRMVYGPGNEDTGCDGGRLPYEDLKAQYRNNRVYFYTGTYPASYTLNFIEAMMTGIPIVSIGKTVANIDPMGGIDAFEVDKIIQNGKNGFISNEVPELREMIQRLIDDKSLAKKIGDAGRETAIELFGKNKIMEEWKGFLESL